MLLKYRKNKEREKIMGSLDDLHIRGISIAINLLKKQGIRLLGKPARDLGSGAGTISALLAINGFNVRAYDIDQDWIRYCNQAHKELGIAFRTKDVLDLSFIPESNLFASVGSVIYWPKSIVNAFLENVWKSLQTGGILHVEFPTQDDCTSQSDFVTYTCYPYPEDHHTNSYLHVCDTYRCGCHGFVKGYSMWEQDEVRTLLSSFGNFRLVYFKVDGWPQIIDDIGSAGSILQRSFIRVTVQKI